MNPERMNWCLTLLLAGMVACQCPAQADRKASNRVQIDPGSRVVLCMPDKQVFNLAADSAKLGSTGERFYDFAVPEKEMMTLCRALSNYDIFHWETMTAASPYPADHVTLLVYGVSPRLNDDLQCSLGAGEPARKVLLALLEHLTGRTKDSIRKAVDKMSERIPKSVQSTPTRADGAAGRD